MFVVGRYCISKSCQAGLMPNVLKGDDPPCIANCLHRSLWLACTALTDKTVGLTILFSPYNKHISITAAMNNSAAKVGEIFREAGTAFNKLSEMTMLLLPGGDSQPGIEAIHIGTHLGFPLHGNVFGGCQLLLSKDLCALFIAEICTLGESSINFKTIIIELKDLILKIMTGKWTDEEIEMLRSCVHRFALDLNKLSQHIKNRTVTQIRTTLKKKAFEDAGIPVRQVTLNMLNASENEVDVEGLGGDVKLEFEAGNEEAT